MQEYIVQVKVTAEMVERAESLIAHCIEAGVITGNFLRSETAKVVSAWEIIKENKQ